MGGAPPPPTGPGFGLLLGGFPAPPPAPGTGVGPGAALAAAVQQAAAQMGIPVPGGVGQIAPQGATPLFGTGGQAQGQVQAGFGIQLPGQAGGVSLPPPAVCGPTAAADTAWLNFTLHPQLLDQLVVQAGMMLEIGVENPPGTLAATALFCVQMGHAVDGEGMTLEVAFAGSSNVAAARVFAQAFPGPQHGSQGLLHLCKGGGCPCAPNHTPTNRVLLHSDLMRIRNPAGINEPWAADWAKPSVQPQGQPGVLPVQGGGPPRCSSRGCRDRWNRWRLVNS